MSLRILIAAGGTGGHVYPALAVAEALVTSRAPVELSFIGCGGLERDLVRESGVPFDSYHDVTGGPVAGVSIGRKLRSGLALLWGAVQSVRLMRRLRPGAALVTGGYSSLPVAMAGRLLGVPIIIFLPDIEPGASIRLLARFAHRVVLTVPESAAYFRLGQTVVTGYPLRQMVTTADRAGGLAHFDLDPARRTLLVFGGSRGARSLNRALLPIAPDLVADGWQLIHISGALDWPEVEAAHAALPAPVRMHYRAFGYLHDAMGAALAAADLVVSRAGASVLAEYPPFGLPSILVPYPHAWRYQKVNADYLAERGAALIVPDEQLAADLLPTIRALAADPHRLRAMGAAAASLAGGDGARAVADLLVQCAGGETR